MVTPRWLRPGRHGPTPLGPCRWFRLPRTAPKRCGRPTRPPASDGWGSRRALQVVSETEITEAAGDVDGVISQSFQEPGNQPHLGRYRGGDVVLGQFGGETH